MENSRSLRKLIRFTEHDFPSIQQQIDEGWSIVSLLALENRYVGIIEKTSENVGEDKEFIHIPPRKKIRLST